MRESGAGKFGIFFGAGAEVGYGMPAGGTFALEIFRRKADDAKARAIFIAQRERIDPDGTYARNWLPHGYRKKRIQAFGVVEKRKIFQDSLEKNREKIAASLEDFDNAAGRAISSLQVEPPAVKSQFSMAAQGAVFGAKTYERAVRVNARLGNARKMFESSYFSAALQLSGTSFENGSIRAITLAALQLYIGALSQGLASELNDTIFTKAPPDLGILEEIGGIFSLDVGQSGQAAFDAVMEHRPKWRTGDEAALLFYAIILRVLEELIASFLDYQSLVDSFYGYLFQPSDWTKFSKISIFLHTVRLYVAEAESSVLKTLSGSEGYYHDLANAVNEERIVLSALGTSNYTSLCDEVMSHTTGRRIVTKLNGSLHEYYDPYLNSIVGSDYITAATQFLVPFMFTQSGVKPMTSIDMARRYVDYYDELIASDVIVVVGFGFNGDDGHINGMIRKAVDDEGKHAVVFVFAPNGIDGYDFESERLGIVRKLRISHDENLRVLPVDATRRSLGGVPWVDAAIAAFVP